MASEVVSEHLLYKFFLPRPPIAAIRVCLPRSFGHTTIKQLAVALKWATLSRRILAYTISHFYHSVRLQPLCAQSTNMA